MYVSALSGRDLSEPPPKSELATHTHQNYTLTRPWLNTLAGGLGHQTIVRNNGATLTPEERAHLHQENGLVMSKPHKIRKAKPAHRDEHGYSTHVSHELEAEVHQHFVTANRTSGAAHAQARSHVMALSGGPLALEPAEKHAQSILSSMASRSAAEPIARSTRASTALHSAPPRDDMPLSVVRTDAPMPWSDAYTAYSQMLGDVHGDGRRMARVIADDFATRTAKHQPAHGGPVQTPPDHGVWDYANVAASQSGQGFYEPDSHKTEALVHLRHEIQEAYNKLNPAFVSRY